MKVKFNGAQGQRVVGCPVCSGRKQIGDLMYSKSYVLSDGKLHYFHTGREYDIPDDNEFLLTYVFTRNGETVHSFEKV